MVNIITVVVLITTLCVFVIWNYIHKNGDNSEEDSFTSYNGNHNSSSLSQHSNNRQFSLAELKSDKSNKYSWDETGCVFEINTDGSVTIVGHFDPSELQENPEQEIFDRINAAELLEMLPRMWSYMTFDKGESCFLLSSNSDCYSCYDYLSTINDVKGIALQQYTVGGEVNPAIDLLCKKRKGYVILLPSNEKEYILSLGTQACLNRIFEKDVRVKISSPSVMGAFGIAISSSGDAKVSFAYGTGDDYQCCNMHAEGGVSEVKELLPDSIILPLEESVAITKIAKGCISQSLLLKNVEGPVLLGMMPYTINLLLKENDNILKNYDIVKCPTKIPAKKSVKEIVVASNNSLSLLIGGYTIIEDIISENNIPCGTMEVAIDIDANQRLNLIVESNNQTYNINIGNLIG